MARRLTALERPAPAIEPQRNDPDPDLAADIDDLEARCEARLADWVAADRAMYPGLPDGTVRACLLRGERNLFHAVRRISREREAQQ